MSRGTAARLAAALLCATGTLTAIPAAAPARDAPRLSVSAAALYAPATGQMLFGQAANRERPIASTTKLMTALIVLQHVRRLTTVLTYPNYHAAATDSQIGLRPGERMTVRDLLVAMMLPSADDAAEDLAYNVGHGSVARFVGMMNAEARQLGLGHTHYSTPIGLDTPGNYSTAADLVRLARYDLTHSRFLARVVALPNAVLGTGPVREVPNLNDLVARVRWIDGVKTGHTSGAGYVLVASGHRDGMTLISAVLGTGSPTERDANTLALLDYGYAAFAPRTPIRADEVMARPAVSDRPGVRVPVTAARSLTRVLARSSDVRVQVQVPPRLAGPLPSGSVVGTAVVVADGRTIDRVPVVLSRALSAVSGLTLAARFVTRPPMLLAIVVVLGLGAVLVRLVRRRGRSDGRGSGWEGA